MGVKTIAKNVLDGWFYKNYLSAARQIYLKGQQDKKFKQWENFEDLKAPFHANRAFLLDDVDIQTFLEVNGQELCCQIFVHPGKYLIFLSSIHFVYQKDFPLLEMFDHYIQKIKQSGITDMLAKKYFTPLVQDCMPLVKEIGLTDTIFIFIVGTSGAGCALIIMCLEICLSFYINKQVQ